MTPSVNATLGMGDTPRCMEINTQIFLWRNNDTLFKHCFESMTGVKLRVEISNIPVKIYFWLGRYCRSRALLDTQIASTLADFVGTDMTMVSIISATVGAVLSALLVLMLEVRAVPIAFTEESENPWLLVGWLSDSSDRD